MNDVSRYKEKIRMGYNEKRKLEGRGEKKTPISGQKSRKEERSHEFKGKME